MNILLSEEYERALQKEDKWITIIGILLFIISFPVVYYLIFTHYESDLQFLSINPVVIKSIIVFVFSLMAYLGVIIVEPLLMLVFIFIYVTLEIFGNMNLRLRDNAEEVQGFLSEKTEEEVNQLIEEWQSKLNQEFVNVLEVEKRLTETNLNKKQKADLIKERLGKMVLWIETPEELVGEVKFGLEKKIQHLEEAKEKMLFNQPLDSDHIQALHSCLK